MPDLTICEINCETKKTLINVKSQLLDCIEQLRADRSQNQAAGLTTIPGDVIITDLSETIEKLDRQISAHIREERRRVSN